MNASRFLVRSLLVTLLTAPLLAREPEHRRWTVEGVEREALVYTPAVPDSQSWPLIFAFHGHGGSMRQVAKSLAVHEAWPEACVVYLQGLPTPGQLTDPEGRRSGWQAGPGDQGDRDLAFFDAVLADLQARHSIDPKRIYATGHSNGGGFTYLLWATRRDAFAAFAPSSAVAHREARRLRPAPVIHIAGRHDALVQFAWQERMIEQLKQTQRCGEGEPQANGSFLFPSALGHPVATYVHDGGHRYPPDATPILVEFFKSHARP